MLSRVSCLCSPSPTVRSSEADDAACDDPFDEWAAPATRCSVRTQSPGSIDSGGRNSSRWSRWAGPTGCGLIHCSFCWPQLCLAGAASLLTALSRVSPVWLDPLSTDQSHEQVQAATVEAATAGQQTMAGCDDDCCYFCCRCRTLPSSRLALFSGAPLLAMLILAARMTQSDSSSEGAGCRKREQQAPQSVDCGWTHKDSNAKHDGDAHTDRRCREEKQRRKQMEEGEAAVRRGLDGEEGRRSSSAHPWSRNLRVLLTHKRNNHDLTSDNDDRAPRGLPIAPESRSTSSSVVVCRVVAPSSRRWLRLPVLCSALHSIWAPVFIASCLQRRVAACFLCSRRASASPSLVLRESCPSHATLHASLLHSRCPSLSDAHCSPPLVAVLVDRPARALFSSQQQASAVLVVSAA